MGVEAWVMEGPNLPCTTPEKAVGSARLQTHETNDAPAQIKRSIRFDPYRIGRDDGGKFRILGLHRRTLIRDGWIAEGSGYSPRTNVRC